MRFTIWRRNGLDFLIMGTYPGATEAEALDNASKDCTYVDAKGQTAHYAGFDDANAKLGLTRDDYKVKKAE